MDRVGLLPVSQDSAGMDNYMHDAVDDRSRALAYSRGGAIHFHAALARFFSRADDWVQSPGTG